MKKIIVTFTIVAAVVIPRLVLAGNEMPGSVELVYQAGYVAGKNYAYMLGAIASSLTFFLGFFAGVKTKK